MSIRIESSSTRKFHDMGDPMEEISLQEKSDLGEALKQLNDDTLDTNTHMSGIDMRARLEDIEISNILAIDALVAFRFLPISVLSFTRSKKRLSVSKGGKGREEIVNIVRGDREHAEEKAGGFRRLLGMGGPKE